MLGHLKNSGPPTGSADNGHLHAAQPLGNDPFGSCDTPAKSLQMVHVLVSSSFLLLTMAFALSTDDLGLFLTLVGSTGDLSYSYLIPGFFYVRLRPDGVHRLSALMLFCMGWVVMLGAIASIVRGDIV